MLDNPQGSSTQESVAMLKEMRQAKQPDLDSETTGGTEEAAVTEPQETKVDSYELETEVDGTTEHDDTGEEVDAPDRYTVKVDGEEVEVNIDELRSGYQRDSDYRKKTMALAEQRKQVEAENSAIAERIQKLDALIGQDEESVDWDSLRDNDPTEFIRRKDLQEQRAKALQDEQAKLAEKQQKQRSALIQQETAKLTEIMGPTWTDDKRVNTFNEANSYLESIGVTQEEANTIIDSRHWKMIFDATEYNKLKGSKTKVAKEIRDAPKSVKPGQRQKAKSQTEVEAATARLQGSNKLNEAQNAVELLKARRGKK